MRISKNVCHHLIQIIVISLCFTNFNGARSQCSSNDWACDNGQCIQDDKLCDGKVDCRDRSDEIAENCIQFQETCQNFAFSCAYGACIDGKAKCNGVQDCADNSDELICTKQDDSDFQGICSDNEIQCVNSKECINSINLCDGRVHCKDGSDESLALCINFGCISFGFQCGYGACISGNAKCNGIKECADGSDEAWELCNTPRKQTNLIGVTPTPIPTPKPTPTPVQYIRCVIPNIPQLQDLIFKLHPRNETIPLGSFVEDYEIIHMQCQHKYTLRGQPSLFCQNGKWNFDFPSCVGYCDGSLLRGVSLRAVCDYRTRFVECPKRIRPGTEIQINCGFGYTRTPNNPQYIKCLTDGTFDNSPKPCEHNCGRVAPNLEALSKNGVPIKSSSAPWHVSIHENNSVNFDYICSGSIVSPSVVITAAHCFWDEPTLTLRNYTEYTIIAGQSTSNFTTIQNEYTQVVQVEEIHIPGEYRGKNGRQREDIAFVKLKTALRYTETIASICLPKIIRNTASKYVLSNENGFVTGYGLKNQLERLKMITLAYHDCREKSPPDAPVADDKFCIFSNEGASVCRGDSGAGFFKEDKNLEDNEITYRLLGVISNTPNTKNDCTRLDDESYVAITNIHYMAADLLRKLLQTIEADRAFFYIPGEGYIRLDTAEYSTLTFLSTLGRLLSKLNSHSQCTSNDWACDNGQCIQDDKLCDGKVDCLDRSDEIAENCIQLHETCQNYNFRCAYGACIDGIAKCNGVQDCADNSDELICSKKNDSNFHGACSDNEIQCVNSKECINSINLCDGQVHCKDGSDESLELCIDFDCISFGFQCGYGACISGNAKCNGTHECADGSDEAWQLCNTLRKKDNLIDLTPSPRPKRTATSTKCNIPNIPQLQDMIFKLHPQNETIPLGSFVDDYEIIHIQCQNKYTLRGQPSLFCQNGKWNFDFPSCVGYCDGSLLRGVSLRAVCDDGTRFVDCPKKLRPGTEIQINCGFGYTRTPNNPQNIKCLPDGTFDKTPVPCEHNCGRVAANSVALSKNGIPITSSLTPWHVTIYEKDGADSNYICSGSIVSPRIVITAAHCFWDEANLILKSNTEYEIIAGRSTSNYTKIDNNNSQTIQIEEIHIPTEYRGKSGNQREDIAFVKLKTALRYTETIAPICLPNDIRNIASNYVMSNQNGFLAGFGVKNQLERLKMLMLSYHDCSQKSPPYAPLTDDKFCIYNNEGASVCRGDSGAGFFKEDKNSEDNEITYRLLGVISNTPNTKNDCTRLDDESYVAITNIHYMASDLKSKLLKAIQEDRALF
ncbi:uncharacterized protein LOC135964186 [Calliphora vicina]|uniref:uncharacterized protein LOC135964186 n=1 Tax=Calliphora vicina TaxID=7373 RepID=UPI00325B37DD